MTVRYHISLPDPEAARAAGGPFAFRAQGAQALAAELEQALRTDALFQRWRAGQEDPDAVDPGLGAVDPSASVVGEPHDLHVDLTVTTSIPGAVLRHRLRLLAGSAWELRDVRAA